MCKLGVSVKVKKWWQKTAHCWSILLLETAGLISLSLQRGMHMCPTPYFHTYPETSAVNVAVYEFLSLKDVKRFPSQHWCKVRIVVFVAVCLIQYCRIMVTFSDLSQHSWRKQQNITVTVRTLESTLAKSCRKLLYHSLSYSLSFSLCLTLSIWFAVTTVSWQSRGVSALSVRYQSP